MVQDESTENQKEAPIKFLTPPNFKRAVLELANERNITLSALLRLIASEYLKRKG